MVQKTKPEKKTWIRDTTETIGYAVVLALIIRSFIIQPFKIPTGSMEPTLMPRDRILVLRYVYGLRIPFTFTRIAKLRTPEAGDIIVFNYPQDIKRDFIKRCAATGGDTIEIRDGVLWRNNQPVKKDPFNKIYYYNRGTYARPGEVLTVPKDSYFALGDNSGNSTDSRFWGFLDDKYIVGKAVLVYWPLDRIRILK